MVCDTPPDGQVVRAPRGESVKILGYHNGIFYDFDCYNKAGHFVVCNKLLLLYKCHLSAHQ